MRAAEDVHAGAFIVKLAISTGSILKIEKRACAGSPRGQIGRKVAEGEVCGGMGWQQLGGMWLCRRCFHAATGDTEARAGAEHLVLLDRCVFPARLSGRVSAPLCGEPAVAEVAGAPACAHHHEGALAWHREMADREHEEKERLGAQFEAEAERRREEEMRTWKADGSQIVYYLRRADGAVKIGTSIEFARRFGNLCREYGALEILLTHCGDFPREREMHKQFADLALGGEWFRAEEPLLSWIIWVRCRRANMNTKIPGTEPLRYVRQMLREVQQMAA